MSLTDQEFECALLASARADNPPTETSAEMTARAWARFSACAAAVGDGLRGEGPPSERANGAGASHSATSRLAAGIRWRWLLVGALGGSAVTSALFALRPPMRVSSLTAATSEASSQVAIPASTFAAPVSPASRIEERPAVRRERRRNAQVDPTAIDPTPLAVPPSTLAAEVAALDAARAAAASGQFEEALTLISRFHYDFPSGELAADAEVVAIEALGARKDHAEMTLRAARFVQQYPDDPHIARIRRLVLPQPSP